MTRFSVLHLRHDTGRGQDSIPPVKVGKGATVGAGSTITKEIGDSELAVARGKQRNIDTWERPTKKV